MTEGQRIKVTFGLDGSINAETIGLKGKKCLASISALEDLLDAETVESSFTKEYFEEELLQDTRSEINNEN